MTTPESCTRSETISAGGSAKTFASSVTRRPPLDWRRCANGEPHTQWMPEAIQLERGYILTGRDVVRDGAHLSRWPLDRPPLPLETSVPGVFAVGDARYRSIKRVASAVGDGATAVREAHEYLAPEHVER